MISNTMSKITIWKLKKHLDNWASTNILSRPKGLFIAKESVGILI